MFLMKLKVVAEDSTPVYVIQYIFIRIAVGAR